MADQGDVLTNLDNIMGGNGASGANGHDDGPIAGLVTQYVKDLSVENPRAPESFQWTEQPQLDVQFNIAARQISDEFTEVELKITTSAKSSQGTAYMVELAYCGLVGMRNMSDDQRHAFSYAEAPRILFPFARRVIADAVRDAGFQPLLLDPIDFQGLYLQQLQQQRLQAEQLAGEPAGEA
ncbi:preprotein translocase subunit SecB [Croceibacterium mercuriale]|uniref:Protein-export protein SecB n=1 Tax=Croceibacterium mercuriale TaxID=1572751 RepID=A0A0B2BZ95_9SPHN|nr:protein-export chaperone SecB [Croceibacterium mercuriale]KHL25026.1 preprotein translocase subunit SecB [Croceibacterium mercuriale]